MKIGIFGRLDSNHISKELESILMEFHKHNIDVLLDQSFLESSLSTHSDFKSVQLLNNDDFSSLDILISIGGDGTILRAVAHIQNLNIPIIGVNIGRLGFLSTIQKKDIHILMKDILRNELKIAKRSVLEIVSPEIDLPFALNDISINRKDTGSMITLKAYLNDQYLSTYWADGLIISTPTGSTGYSLSCGGPIVEPNSNVFAITPIAPHNLSARPLIIPDNIEIRLEVKGRENTHLMSLDSRITPIGNKGTKILIRKAPFKIKLVEAESFIKTLRKKLLWGEDRRN